MILDGGTIDVVKVSITRFKQGVTFMQISEIYDVLTSTGADEAITFQDAKRVFLKWIHFSDSSVLDIIFGAYAAHWLPGERVWLLIVGQSGGAKTEVIRALESIPDTYSTSNLTGKSMISGSRGDSDQDPSLLPKLDGKVLAIKDFTNVLALPASERRAILGILRDTYDGYSAKDFGHVGHVHIRSRFGLIAGVTPAIDKYADVETELGERYLKLRLDHTDPIAAIRRALENSGKEEVMRSDLFIAMGKFFMPYFEREQFPKILVSSDIQENLISLAHVTATIRSRVPRHWKSDALEYDPIPELGTRLAKQMSQLAKGIAIVQNRLEVDDQIFALVRRVASDSVPALRRRVLQCLSQLSKIASTEEIGRQCKLPTKSTRTVLEDLTILKVVEKEISRDSRGQPHQWQLSTEFRSLINSSF